jgi:hypothetical protein
MTLVGSFLFFSLLTWAAVTLVVADLPDLVESAGDGLAAVEELRQRAVPEFQIPGIDGILDFVRDRLEQGSDEAGSTGATT